MFNILIKIKAIIGSKINWQINPTKKLLYTFEKIPNDQTIQDLKENFDFTLDNNILIAHLNDELLNQLLKKLFNLSNSQSFLIEDLPVEETMRSFFEKPEDYL